MKAYKLREFKRLKAKGKTSLEHIAKAIKTASLYRYAEYKKDRQAGLTPMEAYQFADMMVWTEDYL